jgi:hypothetical protein
MVPVVPEQALGVVVGNPVLVLMGGSRRDPDQRVVAGAGGRHVEPVHVPVRGRVQLVPQQDPQEVSWATDRVGRGRVLVQAMTVAGRPATSSVDQRAVRSTSISPPRPRSTRGCTSVVPSAAAEAVPVDPEGGHPRLARPKPRLLQKRPRSPRGPVLTRG